MSNLNLNSNSENNSRVQNIEDADLRLQRAVELYQDASQQLKFVQNQCEQISKLQQQLKQQHQTLKKSFLSNKVNNFQNWQTKLKKISDKIIFDPTLSEGQCKNQSRAKADKVVCSKKKHLQDIFEQKQIEEQRKQIEKLQAKLNDLYGKIQICLKEQCLNEKVMVRIKKQSKRAAKIKILQFIDKQTNQYKGWLQENKTKLHNELLEKQFQQKIVDNLQGMKQLVNKKIINNDYIYDIFGQNSQSMLKIVEQMDKFGQIIKQKCDQFDKQTKQKYKDQYFNKKQKSHESMSKKAKQTSPNNPTTFTQYFQHAQQVIKLVQYSQQYQSLDQQVKKLHIRMDSTIKQTSK